MLERKMSFEYSYTLEERYEGYKIPIVSDAMFNTMLNNESKKQYASYLISLALNMDYKQVYDNIIFVKNKLDKKNKDEKGYEVDFVCNKADERIYIQSAYAMQTLEKQEQELKSLKLINDSFPKVVIAGGMQPTYRNNDGILILHLYDFSLNKVTI